MNSLYISYNGAMEPLLESQCIPYLRELGKKGIDFTLLSFEKKNGSWQRTLNSSFLLKNRLARYGIKWYWLPYHKRPSLPATVFDIFCGLIFSGWMVIGKKIEVIHARSTIPAVIAVILKKIFKLKFIFDMRGINAEEYVDAGLWKRSGLKYKIFKSIEKRILESADSIVVLTNRAAQIISKEGFLSSQRNNLDIRVIPCCVDLAKFNFSPFSKERFTLVYSGSVGTWYMLEEMLDFFIIAQEYIPRAHFLILARSGKDIIERSIGYKKLNKNCVSIINADYSDVPNYLSKADIGIFFIRATFSKQASCPIKMAEYLACGLPLIVNSGVGDVDEIIRSKNIGIVVKEFNENNYRDSTKRLLELLRGRGDLQKRCRQVAQDYFSLEQGVELYWQVYQGLGLKP